jgi:hypothetical protein
MTDLSRLADMAEILGALVVIGGLMFAILQMRQYRQQRRELAAIELFRSFGNPEFNKAYRNILNLPDGLSGAEIENQYPDLEQCAMLICTTMENIGVMTFQRIVPFLLVKNLIGSSAVLLWRRLDGWVADLRVRIDCPEAFEWFQWLAEKLDECQEDSEMPAYEAYKSWKPSNLSSDI